MQTKKEFRPETLFILEHLHEYQVIREAINEAEKDTRYILALLQEDLTEEKWWSDEFEAKLYKQVPTTGIWIYKKKWKQKDWYACFGLENFTIDVIGSDTETAWSYVQLPSQHRNEETRNIFKEYINNNSQLKSKTSWVFNHSKYSIARDFGFSKINKNVTDIKDYLLNEINDISFVIPMIDKILK